MVPERTAVLSALMLALTSTVARWPHGVLGADASLSEPMSPTRGVVGADAGPSEPVSPARGVLGAVAGPSEPMSPARGPRGMLGADDALLEALAGEYGGNRLVVCGGCRARRAAPCLPVRCPAVAWHRRWALVRAWCAADLALEDMRVLRTTKHERTCDAFQKEPVLMADRARRVRAGRLQPLWRADVRYDVALLELDRALSEDEALANDTTARRSLDSVWYWMESVERDFKARESRSQGPGETGYTLLMTGILPAATFFVFFLFIIFGTGSPVQVPYTNQKDGIKTPWMIHGYSSDVKCFPTYGQV